MRRDKRTITYWNGVHVVHQKLDCFTLHFFACAFGCFSLFHQFMVKFNKQQYLILHVCEEVIIPDEIEYIRATEAEVEG